jgi:hypothetical protein
MIRLKVKVRRAYNNRKLGEHYQLDLKEFCKQLLAAKKNAQETILRSVVQNEGKCWSEFYKYVKRRKGNGKIFLQSKIVMVGSLQTQ